MVGMIMTGIFNAIILYWWRSFSLYLLFIGPIFSLIGGGNSVCVAMINAVIADVSTEEDR